MAKRKRTNNDLQNITHKTKEKVTQKDNPGETGNIGYTRRRETGNIGYTRRRETSNIGYTRRRES
jgi:hypothetical protein